MEEIKQSLPEGSFSNVQVLGRRYQRKKQQCVEKENIVMKFEKKKLVLSSILRIVSERKIK